MTSDLTTSFFQFERIIIPKDPLQKLVENLSRTMEESLIALKKVVFLFGVFFWTLYSYSFRQPHITFSLVFVYCKKLFRLRRNVPEQIIKELSYVPSVSVTSVSIGGDGLSVEEAL